LRPADDDFLPDEFVTARIPEACDDVRIESIPRIGHPERVAHARTLLQRIIARHAPSRAFIAGDGAINYALLEDLNAAGVAASRDNLESFFNMPKKSTADSAKPSPLASEASG
jgi:ferredoxin-NADP reductase